MNIYNVASLFLGHHSVTVDVDGAATVSFPIGATNLPVTVTL